MNRYTRIVANTFILSLTSILFAQMTVSGTVTDASSGDALAGANVVVDGTDLGVASDANGAYTLSNVPNGATITASMIGFSSESKDASATLNFRLVTSAVQLSALDVVATRATYRKTPVAFTELDEQDLKLRIGSRDITMVLNETPGVYAHEEGGGAGDSKIYVRGFDQTNTPILINGVPVNDMESGKVYWSNWDGMSDVTSSIQVQRGLGASSLAVASVGGTVNVRTSAAELKSGASYKQELGSDNFMKSTFNFNTGLSPNGFALTGLLQRKTGSGQAYGTWTDAYAYFLTMSKSYKNSVVDAYVVGAPQQHGQRYGDNALTFAQWKETHGKDHKTNSGYNGSYDGSGSGWGYVSKENAQSIKKGNSSLDAVGSALFGDVLHTRQEIGSDKWIINNRTNYYHKPVYGLNWRYKIDDRTSINTVMYYSTGRGGGTGPLNSGGTGLYADDSTDADGNTVNYYAETSVKYINPDPDSDVPGQYNWDGLIDYNSFDNTTAHGNIWLGSDTLSSKYSTLQWNYGRPYDTTYSDDEKRAKSIIRASVNHHDWYGGISTVKHKYSDNLIATLSLDLRKYKGTHFRQVVNLLGGDYFVDKYKNVNDVTSSSQMKRVGDQIAYHNLGHVAWVGYSGQLEYSSGPLSVVTSLAKSSTMYQREDRHNYTPSQYMSERISFPGYAYKVGANYNLGDAINVFANFGRLQTAPKFTSVYLNYKNDVNPKAKPEKVQTLELGAGYSSGSLRANANYYMTNWSDKSLVKTGANDAIYNIDGIEANHSGLELDVDMGVMDWLNLNAALSLGNWTWGKDLDNVVVFDDNNRGGAQDTISIYTDGLHVGGAPQTQFSLGISAAPMEGLIVHPVINYFANFYSDFDPADRGDESMKGVDSYMNDAAMTIDLHTTYSFTLIGYNMTLGLHAFNLTDTEYVNFAIDGGDGTKESARVFYGLGQRFNLSLGVNF